MTKGRCDRCHAEVDGDVAYKQQEWTSWAGKRVRVTAYYCQACAGTLRAIGAGERSAMEERASSRPDMTPEHKEDY